MNDIFCFLLLFTAALFVTAVFLFVWSLVVVYATDQDRVSETVYRSCVAGLFAYSFSFWAFVLSFIAWKLKSIGVSYDFFIGTAVLFDLLSVVVLSCMLRAPENPIEKVISAH